MRFGHQFEFHKIPEWYLQYLDYEGFKLMIEGFKEEVKKGNMIKLPGFYVFTKSRQLISI